MYERTSAADGGGGGVAAATARDAGSGANSLGVKIEAQYTVGEYDILILSAQQSGGLETWLKENGYRIPAGASSVLGSYIRQNMQFFVAQGEPAASKRSSGSPICGRCRSRTSRRSSCCRSASAW